MEISSSLPPPPSDPPPPKKLKMSSTTDTEDESAAAQPSAERKPRFKRRKVAIFLAYCGVGYQGMQKNPGAQTIEADLEEALFLAGAVPEPDRANSKRYDWARSARTDKGVSAVGQVVSGRFYIDPPGLVERLNLHLADQIRIFGYKRVTNSFSAKKFCDRRRYIYLLPVFALDPTSHPDRESVLSSFGSENELSKCVACSERGRKVAGVMGRRNEGSKSLGESYRNSVDTEEAKNESILHLGSVLGEENASGLRGNGDQMVEKVSGQMVEKVSGCHDQVSDSVNCENGRSNSGHLEEKIECRSIWNEEHDVIRESKNYKLEDFDSDSPAVLHSDSAIGEKTNGVRTQFSYGEEEMERFNRILGYYVGTHNFHNFTTRIKAEDPSASRYIVSFEARRIVTIEGVDFVRCEVVGQSFMLHQIRKMIGLAVAVARNAAPEALIQTALRKDLRINVPTAPEVGLYLDECFFSSYNQKWKDTHEEISMGAYTEEAEKFKMEYIYSHIASTELKEGVVGLWLHSLNHRNYPDLQYVEAIGVSGNEKLSADEKPSQEDKNNNEVSIDEICVQKDNNNKAS